MKNKLVKNYTMQFIYQIMLILTPLLTLPYISRILGAENIGIYSYNYSFVTYFIVLSALGVNNHGNRTIASCGDDLEKRSQAFWDIFVSHVLSSCLSFVCYFIYVMFFVKENQDIAWIMIAYIVADMFDISWLYFGMEEISGTVIKNIIIKILTIILIFIFVKEKNDLWIYCLILSFSGVVGSSILWINIGKKVIFKKPSKFFYKNYKALLILSLPVVAYSLYKYIDKIMLGNIVDKIAVGYYENSEKIINIIVGVLSSIGIVLLPRMVPFYKNGEKDKANDYIFKGALFHLFCSSALVFGVAGVSNEVVDCLFGKEFESCKELINLLCVALFFNSWTNYIKSVFYIPNKKDKAFILIMLIGCIINIILNIILIPKYGVYGAAVGTIGSELVVFALQFVFSYKDINYRKIFFYGCEFIIFGALMFWCLKIISFSVQSEIIVLLCKIVTGAIVYLLLSGTYFLIIKKKIMRK